MSRLTRLLGKKSGQSVSDQKDVSLQQALTSNINAAQPSTSSEGDAADQAYGLVFILDTGETRTFASLPISIGRGEQNDIVLKDETISANHARVYYDRRVGGICIEDLDSLNGVFIDNLPTVKNVLQDGAKIRLGNATLSFRDTGFLPPQES